MVVVIFGISFLCAEGFILASRSEGVDIRCCGCFFSLIVHQNVAESEEFRSMDRSCPMIQQPTDLLFFHIAGISK